MPAVGGELLLAGLEVVGPLILKEAIDGQIAQGKTDQLAALAGAYLGILVAMFVFRYVQSVLMNLVGQRVMSDLRQDLFGHLPPKTSPAPRSQL